MSLSKFNCRDKLLLKALSFRKLHPFSSRNLLLRCHQLLSRPRASSLASDYLHRFNYSQKKLEGLARTLLFGSPQQGKSTSPKSNDKPGEESTGSNDNNEKPDDEDDKISSLLVKAVLWMLTAYLFIAIVSLVFPGSNQPEVNTKCLNALGYLVRAVNYLPL